MKKFLIITLTLVVIAVVGRLIVIYLVLSGGVELISEDQMRIVNCYESEEGWNMDMNLPGVLVKNCEEQDLGEVFIFKKI